MAGDCLVFLSCRPFFSSYAGEEKPVAGEHLRYTTRSFASPKIWP